MAPGTWVTGLTAGRRGPGPLSEGQGLEGGRTVSFAITEPKSGERQGGGGGRRVTVA